MEMDLNILRAAMEIDQLHYGWLAGPGNGFQWQKQTHVGTTLEKHAHDHGNAANPPQRTNFPCL